MSFVELGEENDGIKSNSHNSSILSPSIDFLSQDQKILLAERSSRVSRSGNIRQANDFSQKSQDIILKKYLHQHISSTSVDHGRRSLPADDRCYLSSTENEALEEIQDRMAHFQLDTNTEINNQDEDKSIHEQNRRRNIIWARFILILLFIAIILLTVFLVTQNSGVKNSISPNVRGYDFSVEDCSSGNYLDPMRHNSYRLFLMSYYPMLSKSIDTRGSNANVALCWLSQYDKLYENPFPKHEDALAQRFVLVILYFSLTQSDKGMPTDRDVFAKRNWLSQQDVCEWTLVGCDRTSASFRYVTSLDFSDLSINGVSVPSEVALLESLRTLNFNPIGFVGAIPLELSNLIRLEEFEIGVWGPDSTHEVEKFIKSWSQLEQLSLRLTLSNPLPDFGSSTKLKGLEVFDESVYSSYKFPDIQKLSQLGMYFHYISVNFGKADLTRD
jgi:hypothetical protein